MKKVIDGALYNTDTAQFLGAWEPNGYDHGNFSYYCEALYRTKSGKYFIHGEGHARSPYGHWQGNTGGWGEKIRPYTPQEARQWAEEHLDAVDYAEHFGEPEEAADGRETLNLTVPAGVKRKLEKMREDTGKSISQIITDAFA